MTKKLQVLIDNNRNWSELVRQNNPDFFAKLSRQQSPEYLWIGCADSRVPANEVVGLMPGELFVHRNVANIVVHTDLNCLSVLQYAVDILKVKHIIVCGHYGCGGVRSAVCHERLGLIDNWLRNVQDVHYKHQAMLTGLTEETGLMGRMCELNVIEQVMNVSATTVVQDAWDRGQALSVHGWVYGLRDGLVCDLKMDVSLSAETESSYRQALEAVRERIATNG